MIVTTGDTEVRSAFVKTLNAIENIAKTEDVNTGTYTYRYAPFPAVLEEVRRVCQMFSLAVSQAPTANEDGSLLMVTTIIFHESGQFMAFDPMTMKMPQGAQAIGSAVTYMKRYSLMSIFGIATEDDDGKAAHESSHRPPEPTFKTQHEARIRKALGDMTDAELRKKLVADFKVHFGVNLSELPEDLHEEAETWVQTYVATGRPPEEPF